MSAPQGFSPHAGRQGFSLLGRFNVTMPRRLTETSLQDETACKGTTSIFCRDVPVERFPDRISESPRDQDTFHSFTKQQCLYFFPLPQGQGAWRPNRPALGFTMDTKAFLIRACGSW